MRALDQPQRQEIVTVSAARRYTGASPRGAAGDPVPATTQTALERDPGPGLAPTLLLHARGILVLAALRMLEIVMGSVVSNNYHNFEMLHRIYSNK